jgi:hypothetical protein
MSTTLGIPRPQLSHNEAFSHVRYMEEYKRIQQRLAKIQQYIEEIEEDRKKIEVYKIITTRKDEQRRYCQYPNSGQNF